MGMGDGYIPCNKPATKIIRWNRRSDDPVRMCDMCADHNVRNRGGYVVSAYPPPDTAETEPPARRRTRKTTQTCEYASDVVEQHKAKLSKPHYDVLIEAAGTPDYKVIAAALGVTSVGTVKSRLNRARQAIAALIEPEPDRAPQQPEQTILSGG